MCEFYVSFKTYCLCLHFIYDVDEFYCLFCFYCLFYCNRQPELHLDFL